MSNPKPVTDVTVTPSHILRAAALYLVRHGWTQRDFYAPSDALYPAADPYGAISLAATGRRIESLEDTLDEQSPVFNAIAALEEYLTCAAPNAGGLRSYGGYIGGLRSYGGYVDVQEWNDHPNREAGEVVAALRAAADYWDLNEATRSWLSSPAGILREAAMYVRANGYYLSADCRDNYLWTNGESRPPAANATGAIAYMIYGFPVQMPEPAVSDEYRLFRQAINAYVDFLEDRDETAFESETAEGVCADLAAAASLWESKQPQQQA
jgi:hypothetical protein